MHRAIIIGSKKKKSEVQQLVALCSGLYIDAYSNQPFAVQTEAVNINTTLNNRLGADAVIKSITIGEVANDINKSLDKNRNITFDTRINVPLQKEITQPYWLNEKKEEGIFLWPTSSR
ncbi:hypothetical protein LWM68_16010 [Niabella sp. W65]|nr:hypothetical protein [Niabella sp. W65]MCH7364127.1 hypothetical protein [Niabella sp. W65]